MKNLYALFIVGILVLSAAALAEDAATGAATTSPKTSDVKASQPQRTVGNDLRQRRDATPRSTTTKKSMMDSSSMSDMVSKPAMDKSMVVAQFKKDKKDLLEGSSMMKPAMTGRENAMMRGQGKKIGLKRVEGSTVITGGKGKLPEEYALHPRERLDKPNGWQSTGKNGVISTLGK